VRNKRRGFYDQAPGGDDETIGLQNAERLLSPRRMATQDIPIDRIRPNPFQARRTFDGLNELVATINAQGFMSRLRVRPDPTQAGFFQLVYGERRLRAAKEAGLATVPCEVADHSDREMIEVGLAENIQRRDLNPLEEGEAFARFTTELGYSVRGLAERIGKDKGYIQNRIALLQLPEDVRQMVVQRPDTVDAAHQIAKLATVEEREPLINGLLGRELNAQAVRALVREATHDQDDGLNEAEQASAGQPAVMDIDRVLKRDQRTLSVLFARWRSLLNEDGSHAKVADAVSDVALELERLMALIEGSTKDS
jgi:ParB family chromosome partitioning protein